MPFLELAIVRNHLAVSKISDLDIKTLNDVKRYCDHNKSLYGKLISHFLELVEDDIKNKFFDNAYRKVNFIHNLPKDDLDEWDEEYFYLIELPAFIEYLSENKSIDTIKDLIDLIRIRDHCI